MRAFFAFPIKADFLPLKQKLATIKTLRVQNEFHLTIFFFKKLHQQDISPLTDKLFALLAKHSPVVLGKPLLEIKRGVIWIRFEEFGKEFTQLVLQLNRLCGSFGYTRQKRRFLPNITVARFKKKLKDEDLKQIATIKSPFSQISLSTIALFESVLKPKGALHFKLWKSRFR